MSKNISRRELIQKSLAGFGALSVPVVLTACGGDSKDEVVPSVKADFKHGVASGDPLQDRIILWTRISPQDTATRLQINWEIAKDEKFNQLVNSGSVVTSSAQDFTVKIDANKLVAGQQYFYRFKYGNIISPVGKTKTLPSTTNNVKFAVCSCSNYPAGYFYVYREMAKQKVDAIIHLGDYIYEYGQDGYATEDAVKLGRTLPSDNNKEIIKLDDYRKRYALYRTDLDLQAAHQNTPFIVIWDDHELANDAWKEGAENHQADEGSFLDRKLAALQAYFEWMPIRPISDQDHLNIYRQFSYGNLVQLMMLDTRILARDKQLDYADYMTAQGLNITQFQTDLTSQTRTLMGYTQRDWLMAQLESSKATWNVIGQQVLMSKMWIPAELLMSLAAITSGAVDANTLIKMNQQITELVTLKVRLLKGDTSLSAVEKARITTVAPYNLDAWDGYFFEREILYNKLKSLNKKVVVLAGDTHNAWSSDLHTAQGDFVGVELATSSVSSPGMEKYLNISDDQLKAFESAFTTLIDELNYANLKQRGYLNVSFTAEKMQAEWIFVNTIKAAEYSIDDSRTKTLEIDNKFNLIQPVAKTA
ncbi:alkaline phosphatase D family protein [Acinetobacter gerneri]|uniref:Alkaline phosphatase D family protein n=1 Tax=Acinetobacter gerneri TaxID=202952 RepID=A0AAW8JJB1_9GAMM|nr:alkaline phosphatase D family protein [Acinetobacter gerneri]MDQ9010981.1 alkaline phosphatase D family protein [Acinetobacter gerneri]MDQ9015170.1 alkaline phosphatase D family protein [Acinetobacter gerneri]MDQ9026277.1 alkaline phosphatase D family protein [Acinetobacter gerneri]MDQ9053569.1 alkaline phosphatase D family protein [Acinetobacter gerneri]MDQ9061177.1 alkaline phosphatase D family protein [Acinetobacter gerneri]